MPRSAVGRTGHSGSLVTYAFDQDEDYGDELVVRAKWSIDGAQTLNEAAVMLRAYALWLERTAAEGWELTQAIEDDIGVCRK